VAPRIISVGAVSRALLLDFAAAFLSACTSGGAFSGEGQANEGQRNLAAQVFSLVGSSPPGACASLLRKPFASSGGRLSVGFLLPMRSAVDQRRIFSDLHYGIGEVRCAAAGG
jgi:hypothetical protein